MSKTELHCKPCASSVLKKQIYCACSAFNSCRENLVCRSDRFPPHSQTDTFFSCLCSMWQGKGTKEEGGIEKMLLFLRQLLWTTFHSHFCVASRKQVVRAGQQMICIASVDCVQVLDYRLRRSILNYQIKNAT